MYQSLWQKQTFIGAVFYRNIVDFRKPKIEEYHLMMLKATQILSKMKTFEKVSKKSSLELSQKSFFSKIAVEASKPRPEGLKVGVC